jgi:MFS family permease
VGARLAAHEKVFIVEIKSKALKLIVIFGFVSLFADVTYEGARSITGPYLATLGASATAVGIIVGLGEFIGYALRMLSGYLADKTKRYWLLTILGYLINLLAIPPLALAGRWEVAALLIILERFGKGIRVPARDVMLSYATKQTGRGWGFGLHEALDQIGAVLGPLMIAGLLFAHKSYKIAFATLLIPALISLLFLLVARLIFPAPEDMEPKPFQLQPKGFPKAYWLYVFGIALVAAGFVDFALIAYHFQKASTISSDWIPFFYAIAMAVDGVAALIMGRLFDWKGISTLALFTGIAAFFTPLVFFGSFYAALFGMILWGIGLGSHESIMRAIVAELVGPEKRGSAYGVMNLIFGLFWAAGSALIGFLYDRSLIYLLIFSLGAQLAAIPILLAVKVPRSS